MNIEVKNINKTCLDEEAYIKLIKRYSWALKHDILITFDSRIRCYGLYNFDKENKKHIIQISPKVCGFQTKKKKTKDKLYFKIEQKKLDKGSEKYNLISTTIHELYHARQRDVLGTRKWENFDFSFASGIANEDLITFYSQCEVETRTFENKNIIEAVEYYDKIVLANKKSL